MARLIFTLFFGVAGGLIVVSCASSGSNDTSTFAPNLAHDASADRTSTAASVEGGSIVTHTGTAVCTPKTCRDQGYSCGQNGDGCGGAVDCGSCTFPQYCGGGGYSQCGGDLTLGPDGGPLCVPKTCKDLGYDCGPAADGCGNILQCGTCTAPEFCGGGGFDTCGGNSGIGADGGPLTPPCVPATCASLGLDCGPAGDGCGGTLQCGTCRAPAFCGGGGFGKCGGNSGIGPDGGPLVPPCAPTTCAKLGYDCGPAGDGCGGLLQCGTCAGSAICGGGGRPGVCGQGGGTCTGLCSQQVTCDAGGTTTVTGRVVAGTTSAYGTPDPVPNVLVYVPNGPLQPVGSGASCGGCTSDVSGSPLVSATTAYDGTFTLTNVPVGSAIPVVIQLGRWRRGVTFNVTSACGANAVGDIHMPRTQAGEAGDIPGSSNIPLTALSTGNWDAIECVLLKMGVAQSEFTTDGGAAGRIHMYLGNGASMPGTTPDETALMETGGTFMGYDQILLPCWGLAATKTSTELADLVSYANAGGRFFATHYSYTWLYQNNPFNTTATWDVDKNAPAFELSNPAFVGNVSTAVPPAHAGTFAKWLQLVGALSSTNPPQVTLQQARHDVDGVLGSSLDWIDGKDPVDSSAALLHYTFDAPVGGSAACGHAIYSDFHVNTTNLTVGQTFPSECAVAPLTPQEKVLEYMIWDLSSCVRPPPPPTCKPLTCAQQNVGCGPAGDGCGRQLDCGPCPAGQTCGGGGAPYQCGAPPEAGTCTPQTCSQQNIGCGPAGDGCGHLLDCGPCPPGQTCGGGGVPSQCGAPVEAGSCSPETCSQQNIGCGPAGDGCGHAIDCGPCPPGQTCGGGGVPGQCGTGPGCTPLTCAGIHVNCGPAGDGCGGLLDCGQCTAPQTCGGGGTPGQCGGGTR